MLSIETSARMVSGPRHHARPGRIPCWGADPCTAGLPPPPRGWQHASPPPSRKRLQALPDVPWDQSTRRASPAPPGAGLPGELKAGW